jgi:WD40 repeat protein
LNNGAVAARLEGHGAWVSALCELSSGFLASASADGSVRLWETDNGTELACFEGHDALITALCPLPDAGFASASVDRTVRLWRCAQSRPQGASDFKRRLRADARKDVLISNCDVAGIWQKPSSRAREMPSHSSFSAVVDAPGIDEGSSAYGNFEGGQQLSAS